MKTAAAKSSFTDCCSLSQVTPSLIMAAERTLPILYLEQWHGHPKYHESISARYLISRMVKFRFGIDDFLPETTEKGIPIFADENIYWSISHSAGRIFVAVSEKPIGVDMEMITARSPLVLSLISETEWKCCGERSWENFYRMWTAKEALVKRLRCNSDDVFAMQIVSFTEKQCFIGFRGNLYSAQTKRRGNIMLTVVS